MYCSWFLTITVHVDAKRGDTSKLLLYLTVFPHYVIDILAMIIAEFTIDDKYGKGFCTESCSV